MFSKKRAEVRAENTNSQVVSSLCFRGNNKDIAGAGLYYDFPSNQE